MGKSYFPSWSKTDQDEALIVEELCRVIGGAGRFQTCIEAWRAIQKTRKIAGEIRKESRQCAGEDESSSAIESPPEQPA